MHDRLTELEDKQMDMMLRLSNLSMATGSLRNETGKNREMANEAKSQANNASMQASSLDQVSLPPVFELGYQKCCERKRVLSQSGQKAMSVNVLPGPQ